MLSGLSIPPDLGLHWTAARVLHNGGRGWSYRVLDRPQILAQGLDAAKGGLLPDQGLS